MQVTGISKSFPGDAVLDDVTFAAPAGQVTASLGPNGAGKTTTLRIAAGLSRPDSGEVRFGGRLLREMAVPGRSVGFSLDASAFHPGRGALETLRLAALACGAPRTAAREMLDGVGLGKVGRRRVGQLSLGMRQRLALGCALIGSPRHLVLDEPVNGLDVEGVLWIRHLMRQHAEAGGTVLLSSHLLREVQAVGDRVVLLDRGRVVADARPDELVEDDWSVVRAAEPESLAALLSRELVHFERVRDDFRVACSPAVVGRLTAQHRLPLLRLDTAADSGLERTFLRLTSGEFAAGQADRG